MAWIEIWADTRGGGTCRSCGAPVEWAMLVKSSKKMPFDAPIVAVLTKHDPATHRVIETIDSAVTTSHFASCPDRDKWRKDR